METLLQEHRYVLLSKLAEGGYSSCFLVKAQKYEKVFVAKVTALFKNKATATPDQSYLLEVNSLLKLDHPNIILIFDHFRDENYACIIIEYCSAGSVGEIIDKEGLVPYDRLIKYAISAAKAIHFCHRKSIAHHDVKPANFLIGQNDHLKLADFGIARVYRPEQSSDYFAGSLPYMAPEMFKRVPYNPFKADVWAFGVTLYQMLTGTIPFQGSSPEMIRMRISLGEYDLRMITERSYASIIKKCLSPLADERPKMEEVVKMLTLVGKHTKISTKIKIRPCPKKPIYAWKRRSAGLMSFPKQAFTTRIQSWSLDIEDAHQSLVGPRLPSLVN